MSKIKFKIGLFVFISVIGLIIGFFFSGYINLLLSGGNIDDLSALRLATIMASMAENERHRMLALCVELVIVSGIAALMLMSRRETFESDTLAVAGSIETPVAIGQGQHGTARWMNAVEKRKAFSVYRLDRRELPYSELHEAGKQERKEMSEFIDEPEDAGITDETKDSNTETPDSDSTAPAE